MEAPSSQLLKHHNSSRYISFYVVLKEPHPFDIERGVLIFGNLSVK
jgi:hypothetical protein